VQSSSIAAFELFGIFDGGGVAGANAHLLSAARPDRRIVGLQQPCHLDLWPSCGACERPGYQPRPSCYRADEGKALPGIGWPS